MKKSLSLLFSLVLTVTLFAQDAVQQRFASKITTESAHRQLSILTSDEFAGRGTGAAGARIAADYLKSEFKQMGLEAPVNGSFFQSVGLVQIGFETNEFEIGDIALKHGENFYLQGNRSMADFHGEGVLVLGAANYQKVATKDIEENIVFLIGENQETNREMVQSVVQRKPALLLLVSDDTVAFFENAARSRNRPRVKLLEDYVPEQNKRSSVTVGYLTESLANRVLAAAQQTVASLRQSISASNASQSGISLNLNVRGRFGVDSRRFSDDNVLGLLPGSDKKDEIVVIMAHYDHDGVTADGEVIFRGADDNGSGTVGLLELAHAFSEASKDGHGPRRSILFIGLCAEERGLLGSDYYTRYPVLPLENTVAALNMDMIGRIDDKHLDGNHNYIHILGADKLSSELHEITWKANDLYTRMELDTMYNSPADPQRLYYRSDHYNFAKKGIPSVFFFSGLHPHYHTPEDTIEKIDFEMLVKRAHLVFHTAWELANRDKRIVVDSNKP